jgi:hypothetical protein
LGARAILDHYDGIAPHALVAPDDRCDDLRGLDADASPRRECLRGRVRSRAKYDERQQQGAK